MRSKSIKVAGILFLAASAVVTDGALKAAGVAPASPKVKALEDAIDPFAAPAPTTKQRAPGVPLAPRSGDIAREKPDERGKIQGSQRGPSGERAPPQPDRDLPMPKPVPSIIAPSR